MSGKAVTGPGGPRFNGMPARGESSQALLGGGGPGRKAVSLVLFKRQWKISPGCRGKKHSTHPVLGLDREEVFYVSPTYTFQT